LDFTDYFYVADCIASINLSLRRTLVRLSRCVASAGVLITIYHSPLTIHNLANYFKLGKFVAVHGLKGELVLKHELRKKTSLKGLKSVFIEQAKKSFLPWFIESTKIKNNDEVYVKLDGVDTREAAALLARKEVWLAESDFKKHAAKSSPANLLGYTIINEEESLGEIVEVIEQPHQMLCRIEVNDKEVFIPLNEDTLIKIDHPKKEVRVKLPEGLLDIYLA
jgi:16S rRNA processing protein RimM